MSTYYCTVDDVLSVAITFREDVLPESGDTASFRYKTNTISRDDITALILEASDMVRMLYKPRYSITTIDGYDPNFPPIIVHLTKVYTAILMYQRYANQDIERNKGIIESYNRSMRAYSQIIANGALVDTDDERVPTLTDPLILKGADNTDWPSWEDLEELYEDGRTY